MYCHRCGTQNPDGSRYCRLCGTALVEPLSFAPLEGQAGDRPTATPAPSPTATRPPTPLWAEGRPQDLPPMPPRRPGDVRKRRHRRKWYRKLGGLMAGSPTDLLKLLALAGTGGVILLMMRG